MQTHLEFYRFQFQYLKRLLDNIPNDVLYAQQDEGFNSPGWILIHLCIEAEDPLNHFEISYEEIPLEWKNWVKNKAVCNLPTKEELIDILDDRYGLLEKLCHTLTEVQLNAPHPSVMMKNILGTTEAWLVHHMTIHVAIHNGNLTVWKKIMNLEINGF